MVLVNRPPSMTPHAHLDEEVMRLALREIRLLKASVHPNVVHLHEAFRSKSGRVYMIMDHVQHTLTERLRKNPFGFSPRSVKLITWQLLQATAFLHSSKVRR
jgi:cyclin-dependent kinase-like